MIEVAELLLVLEYLERGVLLVGARALLFHANETAGAMLAAGDGILTRRGAVGCRLPEESRGLMRALDEARLGRQSALAVHRRAKPPLSVAVAPLGRNTVSTSGGPVAALLVTDPECETTTSAAHLRELYGLTPAECRTALALLDGACLQDAAVRLAVSVNAVRVHLRHLFEKTGTHRQAELVRVLLAHRLPRAICRLLAVALPWLVDGLDTLPDLG